MEEKNQQKVGQVSKKITGTFEDYQDPYAHIVLSESEIEKALRKARSEKAAEIHRQEYWKRINAPVEYPKMDYDQYKEFVTKRILARHPNFAVDEWNRDIFHSLLLYFMGDPAFEKIPKDKSNPSLGFYSLNKGIALLGGVGCGKTSLMMGFALNPNNPFLAVTCRKVAAEYADQKNGGHQIIDFYSDVISVNPRDHWGHKNVGRFFDDLGTEDKTKHFGNELNVMANIFLDRYEIVDLKAKTHFTSNLSADEIEEVYGQRVRSRVREMFNWIKFDPEAPDRRV
jgi:hypothetical protein